MNIRRFLLPGGSACGLHLVSLATTPKPMQIKVDHASICGSSLNALQDGFAALGLKTDFGGPHAHGGTQMALLGFDDGSYLELIAPQKVGMTLDSGWAKMIAADAGPCAWAIGTSRPERRCCPLQTSRPSYRRTRPRQPHSSRRQSHRMGNRDGRPRDARLDLALHDSRQDSARATGSTFRERERFPAHRNRRCHPRCQGSRCRFRISSAVPMDGTLPPSKTIPSSEPGSPIFPPPRVLATPLGEHSWLPNACRRLEKVPVAYLLGTPDLADASKRYTLSSQSKWFGRNLAWFDAAKVNGIRVGVIQ